MFNVICIHQLSSTSPTPPKHHHHHHVSLSHATVCWFHFGILTETFRQYYHANKAGSFQVPLGEQWLMKDVQ